MTDEKTFDYEPFGINSTKRVTVPEAEEILFKDYGVLDHGFVRLIDYMGSDTAIVQAARVSYGAGTKKVRGDRGLIRYLMSHSHSTPFEMVELKFHAKMPIFVARQWIRHRTANVNEMSGRYSELDKEFFIPRPEDMGYQDTKNRQGRGEVMDPDQAGLMIEILKQDSLRNYEHYEQMLDNGLARELARINLTLNSYTQWYWKIDLHNLFHFLKLRKDPHAQKEIRDYADAMSDMAKRVAPLAYEAFEDFKLNAVNFSSLEQRVLSDVLFEKRAEDELEDLRQVIKGHDKGPYDYRGIEWTQDEITSFESKLTKILGLRHSIIESDE